MRPETRSQRTLAEISDFLGLGRTTKANFEGTVGQPITGIVSDSREVEPGDLFVALSGERKPSSEYLTAALARGARAILTDEAGGRAAAAAHLSVPTLVVSKPRASCGPLADWFYGSPSRSTFVAGITGTNGKTTTTYLLDQIWRAAGRRSGVIGTISLRIGDLELPATHTTPTSDQIQRILARAIELGVRNIAMEVSSHALTQDRVRGTHFTAVGFTNLTQDHLDYHGSMAEYFEAKRSLFANEYAQQAFIVVDNEYGRRLHQSIEIPAVALSTKERADWYLERCEATPSGFAIAIRGKGGVAIEGETHLLGAYNLENLILAVAIASESGVDPLVISQALGDLAGAPGRMERVAISAPFTAIVDYAHTPDAVQRVLQAVRSTAGGRVIAVLGCGGDRDATKRPLMGAALNELADIPIFTSDNPRGEDPEKIIAEMVASVELTNAAEQIVDRRSAIRRAVALAQAGDVVIILGKGHEVGQEIAGKKIPFSDRDEIIMAIKAER